MVKKRTRSSYGRRVARKKYDITVVRRVVLWVIGLTIATVVVGVVVCLVWSNERVTKAKLDAMAKDYYEGYIYENLISGAMSQDEINKTMERYEGWGFAPVNLRQLLSYDEQKNGKGAEFVKNYCDENDTSVKYYPEVPYDKKSYRLEYKYVCEW
ncbi:hypothetical protein IKF30_03275 [Candidatus Saccharibacteria bacterium]|nr:hypothetical protein [Candidatus Saccharibacteria bacterium]